MDEPTAALEGLDAGALAAMVMGARKGGPMGGPMGGQMGGQ